MAMTRVYVSGPYSTGDVSRNVRNAMSVTAALIKAGYAPLCPHLTHFLDLAHPQPYETWMDVDLAWVDVSDCVLRLPGESAGGDRECARAKALGIPVFHFLTDLEEWAKGGS